MATLVQFLAAGVNGAQSGTATFVLRGTASSAASVLYNDFEEVAQPGTNIITLDSNGAAEIYCDAYVDVEIKNSAGTTLRTVTVGHSAPVVEVRSDSFTGTDYDGNPANTAGQPITLKAVLDKWNDSAGANDWKVLIGGVSTNIQTGFAGISGLIFNVKDPTYGAVGDGVTDDTTAILAATTAAAGAPVYFPPGTYKITTLSLSGVNINWVGAGEGASIISGSTSTNLIALTDSTNTGWKNFSGLSFTSSGSYTRLFSLTNDQNVSFHRCSFDASQCAAEAILTDDDEGLSKIIISDCDVTVGASTARGLRNQAETGERSISVKGTSFKIPSGFTGRLIQGADFTVTGCRFDASEVTSGTYRMIDSEDGQVTGKYVGTFTGNKFIDGGSGGFVFELTSISADCDFSEDSNIFTGFIAPSASGDKGQTYEITDAESGVPGDIHLGSRKGRLVYVTAAAAFTVSACLEAETVVVEQTLTALLQLSIPALLPGIAGRVVVFKGNGLGDHTVNFSDSAVHGAFLNLSDAGAGSPETPTITSNEVASCGYVCVSRADGTYRSLITYEVQHQS